MNKITVKINGKLKKCDNHFSDHKTSSQDMLSGNKMADEIGDLYIDHRINLPEVQWMQVMKALRIHGFKITFVRNK